MTPTDRHASDRGVLALVASATLVSVVVINPWRETAFTDDWVYATMVRGVLETGQFQSHPWAAANPWFLTVWGTAASLLFGYSFTTLRLSALLLNILGVTAFFLLCRQHRLPVRHAALASLVFLGSPLMVRHAFSFMTDVPFIALSIGALVLYTHGLRRGSMSVMLLGGVCAAAAVLTRQFGVAFVPALVLVWLTSPLRSQNLWPLIAGMVPPSAAGLWQLQEGMHQQAWTAQWRSAEQMDFLMSATFVLDLWWRAVVTPVHLALYGLPLALAVAVRRDGAGTQRPWLPMVGGRVGLAYLSCCLVVLMAGAHVLGRPLLMPLIDWNLASLASWPRPVRAFVTVILIFLAAGLCSTVVRHYRQAGHPPAESGARLLDYFTVFLFLGQLVYVQFSDRYLLVLLPFVVIVIGRELRHREKLRPRAFQYSMAMALTMLVVSTAWERGTLARGEALWTGSEWLRQHGVSPEQVHSESWEWEYYQGSFDRWLASQHDPKTANFNDFFDRFWPEAWQRARYLVAVRAPGQPPEPGKLLLTIPYRDTVLRIRYVDVLDKKPDGDSLPPHVDATPGP
jgi:4-amino-4-deoxy-L-arabinose transferase-like glycosyltransferase